MIHAAGPGLHFASLTPHAYSGEDVEFMMQVARAGGGGGNALNWEAARAYEQQLARERDRLRALLEINNAVVTCRDGNELFQAISASLRKALSRPKGS